MLYTEVYSDIQLIRLLLLMHLDLQATHFHDLFLPYDFTLFVSTMCE